MTKKNCAIACFIGIFLGVMTLAPELSRAQGADYLSPMSLAADKAGKTLYIGEFTAKQVAVYNVGKEKVAKVFALPDSPGGLALSPSGDLLCVTGASPEGKIYALDPRGGRILWSLPTGHTPLAPVFSPDGKALYICNRFSQNVVIIDPALRKAVGKITVAREPVAAAITPDGKWLLVANHLPTGPANGSYVAAAVSIIDTTKGKEVAEVQLPNGSTALQGLCVSPDGHYAYVTHILAHYQLPTTQLERGWMNTNALSIIDVAGQTLANTVLLDDLDRGAANPWAVTCTADGQWLCVTHAGSHELSIIDRAGLHGRLAQVKAGKQVCASASAEEVPSDLTFLVGLRRRLCMDGQGPRGIAAVGQKIFVSEYFSDCLGLVDLARPGETKLRTLALGPSRPITIVRRGEMLFHDASACFQTWQSCASCHPGEGRVDGLNWDLLNDGIGNPKNTKSLLLAHQTPPVMSLGVRDRAETAVRAGIKYIQFATRPESDAQAIDEYLKALRPVPSPYLVQGQLSPAAQRGRLTFERAGCVECHTPPLFTNLKQYNVGTGAGRQEEGLKFDTPTLIEVWRTAPYLHDGRAMSVMEVMKQGNPNNQHGKTAGLSKQELSELAEFVLSQ